MPNTPLSPEQLISPPRPLPECVTVIPNVITRELAADAATQVLADSRYWIDRGGFYTLGATAYLDPPSVYPAMACAFNDVLIAREVYRKLIRLAGAAAATAALGEVFFDAAELMTLEGFAVPGFHICDAYSNGLQGSVHIDQPYLRVKWPNGCERPFSFTLALALPAGGAGMNMWPALRDVPMVGFNPCASTPQPTYVPYDVGSLYVHDGHTPHQMSSTCHIGLSERRITLQGHGAVDNSGNVCVYF